MILLRRIRHGCCWYCCCLLLFFTARNNRTGNKNYTYATAITLQRQQRPTDDDTKKEKRSTTTQQSFHSSSTSSSSNAVWKALQQLQETLQNQRNTDGAVTNQQQEQEQDDDDQTENTTNKRRRVIRRRLTSSSSSSSSYASSSSSSTTNTKRRAWMEYTLRRHYYQQYQQQQQTRSSKQRQRVRHDKRQQEEQEHDHHLLHVSRGDYSWGHGPCIFYNHLKSSYWTFQYCSPRTNDVVTNDNNINNHGANNNDDDGSNERNGRRSTTTTTTTPLVGQAHWIATSYKGEYRPEVKHSLGTFLRPQQQQGQVESDRRHNVNDDDTIEQQVKERDDDDNDVGNYDIDGTFWNDLLHVESYDSIEYFVNGDECHVGNDDHDNDGRSYSRTTPVRIRRNSVVLKNPIPQCGLMDDNDNDDSHSRHHHRRHVVWKEWKIVAVTEPKSCHYVFYLCGPKRNSRSQQQQQQDDPSSTAHRTDDVDDDEKQQDALVDDNDDDDKEEEDDDVLLSSSPVLQAYLLHEDAHGLHHHDHHQQEQEQSTTTSAGGFQMTIDRTTSWHMAFPPLPPSKIDANRHLIKRMFQHAYDSYMYNAYPAAEIQPLTCTPGTFSLVKVDGLTLIDALDTLLIMDNVTEFARSVERLRLLNATTSGSSSSVSDSGGGLFAVNQNVSVFETNIRVLGGLLSAHQLAQAYLVNNDNDDRFRVLLDDVWETPNKVVRHGGHAPVTNVVVDDDMDDGNVQSDASDQTTVVDEMGETVTELQPPSRNDNVETCQTTTQDQECTPTTTATTSSSSSSSLVTERTENLVCHEQDKKKQNTTKSSSVSYWAYDGFLLELAHDLGKRLLPAFDTRTGIPYGTVNLLTGIPHGETTVASLAGGGTLSLEMELLSRLTGDESFGKAAKLASRALWARRSPRHDLLGKHIDIQKGEWTEALSGIGSNSDSFYEYLIKHHILFPDDTDFWTMFVAVYNGVHNGTRTGEWYADVDMSLGTKQGASRRVFESLQAFYPGMQTLVGELGPAARSLNSFFMVREYLGFLPERFNYGNWKVDGGPHGAGLHPLRPELLESCYFLHQATKRQAGVVNSSTSSSQSASGWLWAADFALHTLNELTDTPCGYATIKNLSPKTTGAVPPQDVDGIKLVNEMPSFFLSETLKYLYLTFDDDNILHRDDEREWVFTTEAHPIHFVPKRKASLPTEQETATKSVLDSKKQKIKDLLIARRSKNYSKHRNKRKAPPSKTTGLTSEKWAANTHLANHIHELRECESHTMKRKFEQRNQRLFRQYLEFSSTDEVNYAYTSYGDLGMGDGSSLRKSCPNFHKSSLLWVRALNGGVLDYAEMFLSSVSDELFGEEKPITLSSVEALSLYQSGLFLGLYPQGPTCSASAEPATELIKPNATPLDRNVQRFNLGGKMGEFEISAFAEGFMIQRLKTGESIVTTVLMTEEQDDEDTEGSPSSNPFVMAYSIDLEQSPNSSDDSSPRKWTGARLKSIFGRNKPHSSLEVKERATIITDARNNAFRCEIQLFASGEENQDGEDELLAVCPCAPALFGPSRLSRLTKLGEFQVDGDIRLPAQFDGCGCSQQEYHHAPTTIQIVHRGICTFQAKAINQQLRSGAEAVIVINSEPDELFVMAEGGIEDMDVADDDGPLTVMVTKNDGEIISTAIEQGLVSTARVQLVPHTCEVDQKGNVVGPVEWPIVRATSESLVQVFSEHGWGVHAINRAKQGDDGGQEWQIFLLEHQLNA